MSEIHLTHKPVKTSVSDPTDSYNSLVPLWKKSRAVLQGESNAKAHDLSLASSDYMERLLIPFSPDMSFEQYNFLVKEAELPGLTAQYAKLLISSLLRKESQIELPDSVPEEAENWIRNNFTLDGRSVFNFLDAALWEEIQTSRCWVYVDYPEVSDEEYESMDKEMRDIITPYPVIIKAESVINYHTATHPITRHKTLTRFITRYVVERFTEENPWHPEYVDTVSDHYLDKDGFLVIDIYENDESNEELSSVNGEVKQNLANSNVGTQFKLVDTIIPKMNGKRVSRIPAWPLNGHLDPVEPVLIPLVDREVALYNKITRRNHLLYGASTYTPILKSDMSEEEFDQVVSAGLGSWIKIGPDDSLDVLKTPTEALADMETAITNTIEDMAKMGIRMLSPETAQSGIALEIRNASQTAQLGTLNAKVSSTMEEIISFMLSWKYDIDITANDLKFQLSADFTPLVGGDAAMNIVTNWYQSGIINRSTFISIAKYNDYLPADYNDEDAQVEIQQDPLLNLVPDDQVSVEQ